MKNSVIYIDSRGPLHIVFWGFNVLGKYSTLFEAQLCAGLSDMYVPSYWIYAEDLAGALIGPFKTKIEAYSHITFCEARGDSATTKIIEAREAEAMNKDIQRLTPEADRGGRCHCEGHSSRLRNPLEGG